MSLNWKEIDLVLSELDLPGCFVQKILQPSYELVALVLYKEGRTRTLLISIAPGACRIHETTRPVPKSDKPLRFAEFLKSRIRGGRIEEVVQLGTDRIVRIALRRADERLLLYARLWSNAANLVVTDASGTVLDAMRRNPRRGEVTGGRYAPDEELAADGLAAHGKGGGEGKRSPNDAVQEQGAAMAGAVPAGAVIVGAATPDGPSAGRTQTGKPKREYAVRELPGEGSFNERVDAWYARSGGALSLDALKEQARKGFDGRMARLSTALESLARKRDEYAGADGLKRYGDLILSAPPDAKPVPGAGDTAWLELEDFYSGGRARIKIDPRKSLSANAEDYYASYRKAKSGLQEVEDELRSGEAELRTLQEERDRLLSMDSPLLLHKALRRIRTAPTTPEKKARPGLSFRVDGWLLVVGRTAAENDELLRRHVKGSDLWLHARDYPGAYVFVKAKAGKTVPLDLLLDAGNLALFYSKGRASGEGDLYYTQAKYLRRAKDAPKGTVLPTQEKNLRIRLDHERLKRLENSREE